MHLLTHTHTHTHKYMADLCTNIHTVQWEREGAGGVHIYNATEIYECNVIFQLAVQIMRGRGGNTLSLTSYLFIHLYVSIYLFIYFSLYLSFNLSIIIYYFYKE